MIPSLFLFRRFTICAAIVYQNNILLQVVTLLLGVVAQFALIGLDPYLSDSLARQQYFDESMTLLTLYTFLCFTKFVPQAQIQYMIGFVSSTIVLIHLAVNLGLITKISVHSGILYLKRCFYRRKQKAARVRAANPVKPILWRLRDLELAARPKKPSLV